jgi:uncharacterized protein (TIGR02687 family)
MDASKITESLSKLFHAEGCRIVFWNDPDQEFLETVAELDLDGVTLINSDNESLLKLKVKLELEDTTGKYLIYSPAMEPAPEDDWLLDIRLYSRSFHADRASILMGELGLTSQSMRAHLSDRKKFLNSKERVSRLKKLVASEDQERDIDMKILAVLSRADQAGIFDILMKLFGEMCSDDACDFKSPTKAWQDIEKFDLAPFFWEQMTKTFGYDAESPSLSDLLIRLLVNDFANTLKGDISGSLAHFLLKEKSLATNASVFVAQWRSHLNHFRQYGLIAREVAKELRLDEQLGGYDEESLLDVMTFEAVERQVIRSLRTKITQGKLEKPEDLKPAILRRRDGHWASIQLEEYADGGNIYATTYDALDATLELLSLRKLHDAGFSFASAEAMYQAYTSELYRFDQLYRLFHEDADRVELAGWDVLKDVQKVVESCYSGWFLDQFSVCWGGFLEGRDGLLERWSIPSVPSQQDFYAHQVKPILQSHARSKVFVIISDALRFEVAEELTREVNSKFRFKAALSSQLGVLPSYTALGMASLLPHREYGYKDDSDQVLVDGQSCASLEHRGAILSGVDGIAVKADDLLAMSKDDGRELVRPWRVVYIYHNQIDATGDSAPTEGKTFSAARRTIEEISSLVRFIVNSLNGSNVFITADHGFLYQDTPPTPLEKSALGYKPEGVAKAKKRYVLGRGLGESEKAWHGSTRVTAGTSDDMEFWIPKGINRFHFAGGARFIHGGALPQEIVVPIVQVRELEGKAAEKEAIKQVGVSLLGSNRKIVNYIQKFELIQTEKVSERMTPRTLVVSLRDGDTLISNEETVTFDSASDSMEERKRTVKLMLKKGNYDNKKDYSLVLRDPETQIECERVPMTIDLAFINDF